MQSADATAQGIYDYDLPSGATTPTVNPRTAALAAPDDVWADFRALAGYRPIAQVLGDLVAHEVDRYRSRRLKDNTLEPRELIDALDRAHHQQQDLAAIIARLEALRETSPR